MPVMSDGGQTREGSAPGRGRLEGRRVLVVGAGQQRGDEDVIGNGRAISALCAREGAAVACADIDGEAAQETVDLIRHEGGSGVAVTANAGDEDDSARMVSEAVDQLDGLDGLVLNVGIARGQGLGGTSVKHWDLVFGINVRGHFMALRNALPEMPGGGSAVLVSSIAGHMALGDVTAYNASKAALVGLCQSAAKEVASRDVRVNIVVPGLIDTPLGRMASAARPDRGEEPIPLGRQGTAWEVAYAALYLLSHESSYVTGQTLVVDGGMLTLR